MNIDVNEQFECVGINDLYCSAVGCIRYFPKEKEFMLCPDLKLKDEYAIFKM